MMKNGFNILICALLLLSAVACEEQYEAPNSFSDLAWYTNKQNKGDYKVKVGQHMSFMDLSQNATSHSWTIEQGNKFLLTGFTEKDDLTTFIDAEKDLITDDLTVHVLFQNKGLNTVTLYNTFSEKVTYRGTENYSAVKLGNEWIVDTSFVVDVYGPLLPAFKVIKIIDDEFGNIINEEEILFVSQDDTISLRDSSQWPTVELEAGSRLKFLDLTTEDRPNARTWTINNQAPASTHNDSASFVYFNSLGYIDMVGTLKSQRIQESGGDIPTAVASKIIPLKVNVIKSSQPFVALNEFSDIAGKEAISFVVSGEVKSIDNSANAITVHVKNPNTGFDENIAVASVMTNSSNASIIEVLLADSIYGNDQITVSFDNTIGTITSVDGRELSSFTDREVTMSMNGQNIFVNSEGTPLRWVGYEEATNTNANNAYMAVDANTGTWWAAQPAFYKSESKSFTGTASLRFQGDATASNQLWRFTPQKAVDIPSGTCLIRQRIFIESGSDIKVLTNALGAKTSGWSDHLTIDWDVSESAVPRDKWVLLETTTNNILASTNPSVSDMRWMVSVKPDLNSGIKADQSFYLDDLEWIPVDSRP